MGVVRLNSLPYIKCIWNPHMGGFTEVQSNAVILTFEVHHQYWQSSNGQSYSALQSGNTFGSGDVGIGAEMFRQEFSKPAFSLVGFRNNHQLLAAPPTLGAYDQILEGIFGFPGMISMKVVITEMIQLPVNNFPQDESTRQSLPTSNRNLRETKGFITKKKEENNLKTNPIVTLLLKIYISL